MSNTPSTHRRRQASKPYVQPPKQKKRSVIPALLLFAALLAVIIIILPKEPVRRALVTVATQDGHINAGSKTSQYDGLRISEVMTANSSAVPDENGEYSDYIEIWNSSENPISLKNVGLSNRGDRIRFIFPDYTLAPDERIVVYANSTNRIDSINALHAKFKLSSIGVTVYLYDSNAYVIDQVTVPILNANEAFALTADNTYEITTQYTPGYPNTEEGFLAYRNAFQVQEGVVILNEVMADAKSQLLPDEDGELSDWIELYNNSNAPFPLGNLFLSDNEEKPLKWKFPEDAVIPANGYYLVFCSGKNRGANASGIPHTNFRISAERDTVILSDSRGRLMDRVAIDNLPADKSYGRNESGQWQVYNVATPLQPNNAQGAAASDQLLRARNTTGVIISEVIASNSTIVIASDQPNTDAVELLNTTNEIQYLDGFALSDNVSRARKWQFPTGAAILPGQYLVVYLDGKPELTTSNQFHTNFKLKRTGGETICFSNPQGVVLDKIDLPLIPTDISYGRTLGINGFYFYDAPTLGAANGTGFYGYAEVPSLSLRGGLYYDTVDVTINVPEGTTVHYTLDGSIPTQQHDIYQGQTIRLNYTGVVRARAFKEDYQPSDIATQSYFINAMHTLPLVSISIDPDELYSETDGLFTVGPNIDKSKGIPFRNAIYRDFGKTPRACHVEYYSQDNQVIFAQGLEMSLSGANSLDIPQKSLKFRAKSKQGAKYIEAALFPDRPFTQYKSFVLRMGGNDGIWTRMLDGLQSRLVDDLDTTVIHQAFNPVAVYINGTYWGHYNMRERKDRFFIAQHEGLPLDQADNMDIIRGGGRAEYGSAKEFNDLLKKAKSLSPGKKEEDLKYITDRIDVDNYLDYIAIEMFFGNSDVGNMQIYKIKGEGNKFKWLLYDLDYGLFNSSYDSPKSYLKSSGMGQDNVNNTLIVKLLENDAMRDKFLTRLGEVFQLFTSDYMIAKLNELIAIIQPELPLHFARWAEFTDKAIIAEAPTDPAGAYRYWDYRTNTRLVNTLKKRPTLFYDMVQTQFKLSEAEMAHYFGAKPPMPEGVT